MDQAIKPNIDNGVEILRGLREGQFRVHYQPQIDLRDGHICGVEALLRWDHPEFGAIPPGDFIPAAESSGAIIELGSFALLEACRQGKEWMRCGRLVNVSVNVSPLQLSQAFVQTVEDVLRETRLHPAFLELEVTEGVQIHIDTEDALPLFDLADRVGVRIALDDFGTGFCNLGYLFFLPVHVLKIDRSIVSGSDHDLQQSIVSIAREMDVEIVAEGIETIEQAERFAKLGCKRGQGYFFGRAVPADQVFLEEEFF